MMRKHNPPQNLPWKSHKNINSQVLVPLTDNNESTVPKYSHWQLQKVSKPLVNYNGFSGKFGAWLNLKFAWYYSMKLFTGIGWKNLKFFCRTLMGITCFDIIIDLDSCFGLKIRNYGQALIPVRLILWEVLMIILGLVICYCNKLRLAKYWTGLYCIPSFRARFQFPFW